jgi:hypothetical protein
LLESDCWHGTRPDSELLGAPSAYGNRNWGWMLPPSLPSNGPKFCSHQVGLYTTITWQNNSPTRPRQWQASAEVPQLSAALAAQVEQDPWQQLTDELALKGALLEQAEANGRQSTARADIAAGAKGRRTCKQCKRSSTSCPCLATSTVRALHLQEATSRVTDAERAQPTCIRADQAI